MKKTFYEFCTGNKSPLCFPLTVSFSGRIKIKWQRSYLSAYIFFKFLLHIKLMKFWCNFAEILYSSKLQRYKILPFCSKLHSWFYRTQRDVKYTLPQTFKIVLTFKLSYNISFMYFKVSINYRNLVWTDYKYLHIVKFSCSIVARLYIYFIDVIVVFFYLIQ